jgi:CRISPR-associated endonuclease Cas2
VSLILDILDEMWNTTLSYKGVPVNIFGAPHFKKQNYRSLQNVLYRLDKIGLANKHKSGYSITKEGKKYLDTHKQDLKQFTTPFKKSDSKDLILMFDIPQEKRGHRDWLRRQLKEFGYIMVQQSVWVGPSPLPKEFKNYMKELKMKNNVKTFKLAKGYNLK